MSVLIDFSQLVIASAFVAQKQVLDPKKDDLGGLTKHIFFGSMLNYAKKFRYDYGSLVTLCDSRSWRKEYFPHYKCMRAVARKDSPMDWDVVFEVMNTLQNDLTELNFPVVKVNRAETDDIVASICGMGGKHMIISSDKDFAQLHRPGIGQFSPYTKNPIKIDDPATELKRLVVKGDESDAIPNILTDNEFYYRKSQGAKERQKSIIGLDELVKGDITHLTYYERNATLIDFEYIPEDVRSACVAEFEIQRTNKFKPNDLRMYFAKNKMRVLLESVSDFQAVNEPKDTYVQEDGSWRF